MLDSSLTENNVNCSRSHGFVRIIFIWLLKGTQTRTILHVFFWLLFYYNVTTVAVCVYTTKRIITTLAKTKKKIKKKKKRKKGIKVILACISRATTNVSTLILLYNVHSQWHRTNLKNKAQMRRKKRLNMSASISKYDATTLNRKKYREVRKIEWKNIKLKNKS